MKTGGVIDARTIIGMVDMWLLVSGLIMYDPKEIFHSAATVIAVLCCVHATKHLKHW